MGRQGVQRPLSLLAIPPALATGLFLWMSFAERKSACHGNMANKPSSDTSLNAAMHGDTTIASIMHAARIVHRAIHLVLLFAPVLLLAPLTGLHPWIRKLWQTLLSMTMRSSGPAFVKWGQWAATRPDLIPADTCAVLERLQTDAPQHSFETTRVTVESAFERPLDELFSEFSAAPVASGAIAQVHKAKLTRLGAEMTGQAEGQVRILKT